MKRFLALTLIFAMLFVMAACGDDSTETTTTAESTTETTTEAAVDPETPAENEGEFKAGVYTATSSYAAEGMNMTWNFVLTLQADGTFTLTDAEGTDKGNGTYALTGNCYSLTYSDERTGAFVVQKDGSLKITEDFPYGMAKIQLALVGDIIFTFESDVPAGEDTPAEGGEEDDGTVYTIAAGTYKATYEKVSAMAGTVVYNYTATIGEDGTFAYSVTFAMGETMMDGSSASGTYTVNGNDFIFTDSEGNEIVGKLTGENALTIELKASQMASAPYEVTFTGETYTIAAGTYAASYEKVSAMAGTVVYNYTATIGEDGTFAYSVAFAMGETMMDGSSASGTYTVNGNDFIFTDSEGNETVGKLTGENALTIELKASQMATAPYEVTFVQSAE